MTGGPQIGPSRPGPRLGLWGLFDLDELGAAVLPRITAHELARRLQGSGVTATVLHRSVVHTAFGAEDPTRRAPER